MKTLIILAAAITQLCGIALGGNGYGLPTGSLVITTVEPPTSQSLLQSAVGFNYDVVGIASFANGGKFDPHGSLGITRSWQSVNLAMTPPVPGDKDYPANSGFKAGGRDYGTYEAGFIDDCSGSVQVGGHGEEIIQLVYTDSDGEFVIAQAVIYLFPYIPTQTNPPTVAFSNTLANSAPLLTFTPNVSQGAVPVNTFQGDPPHITAQLNSLYPGATSWLIIYPNTPATNPARSGAVTLANSTLTDAQNNGLWNRSFTFGLWPALTSCPGFNQTATGLQTYTVEAIEKLPAIYGNNACGQSVAQQVISSVTFSVDLSFQVNTQLSF